MSQGAGGRSRADALRATEEWFDRHGLPYFVPENCDAVRGALRLGRTLPLLVLALAVAGAAGGVLAWLGDELTFAPAALVTIVLLASGWYALTALRAGGILTWAVARTLRSFTTLLSMSTRALPLLLLFITFLFINTEVWQVGSGLRLGDLWLAVLLFTLLAVAYLLVRLPEEVDRADDGMDAETLVRSCAGTPLEGHVDGLGAVTAEQAEVAGLERWNLLLVLLVVQLTQILLLTLSVVLFLVVFGSLVITPGVVESWLGEPGHRLLGLDRVTRELVQVSVFLGAFSGFYLTVSTLTDDKYRQELYGEVGRHLQRAVGVRAAYRAIRARGEGTVLD